LNSGAHVASEKKWPMPTSEKKAIVSRSRATRMPSVVRTEIAAAAASAVRIAF